MAKRKGYTTAAKPMSEEDWQIDCDLRAVAQAAAVKADPERMKKVRALAKKKLDESKRKKDEAQMLIDLGQGGS